AVDQHVAGAVDRGSGPGRCAQLGGDRLVRRRRALGGAAGGEQSATEREELPRDAAHRLGGEGSSGTADESGGGQPGGVRERETAERGECVNRSWRKSSASCMSFMIRSTPPVGRSGSCRRPSG